MRTPDMQPRRAILAPRPGFTAGMVARPIRHRTVIRKPRFIRRKTGKLHAHDLSSRASH